MHNIYTFSIPYPPSVNHYWGRTKTGRQFLSKKGIAFRKSVAASVLLARNKDVFPLPSVPISGDVDLILFVYPPDKRTRDLDNILKATLDALTHAGVWLDDSQVKRLLVERACVPLTGNGGVLVTIRRMQ